MIQLKNLFIRTACGKPVDLLKASPIVINASEPYGRHNFIIYKTINGFYVKGINTGSQTELVNCFELISQNEAMYHLQQQTANRQLLHKKTKE